AKTIIECLPSYLKKKDNNFKFEEKRYFHCCRIKVKGQGFNGFKYFCRGFKQ
ncbi:hypothetical protein, partial [Plasmodium yoelii yoelii]